MRASNVSRETLEAAAAQVGVRAEIEPMSESGRRWRVKLFPIVTAEMLTPRGRRRVVGGERVAARYQRVSASWHGSGRMVNAVCWHGFRDFFRAVYSREPGAVFRTAVATWRGSEDFEKKYQESGWRNIGAPIAPVGMCEACCCPESGRAA